MLEKTVEACVHASRAPDRASSLDGWGRRAGKAMCPAQGRPGWTAAGRSELPPGSQCSALHCAVSGNLGSLFCHVHPHHAFT